MSKFKFFDEPTPTSVNEKNISHTPREAIKAATPNFSSETARYRCEQFNTTKIEDHINFHCDIKKQYLLELSSDNKARVKLEQYLYKINPGYFGDAIEATKELEFDKENVIFSLFDDNTIRGIDNLPEIQQKWEAFKPKLISSEFYKTLAQHNQQAANELIAGGNMEFGTEESLRKTYEKSLFYHVIFSDYDHIKDRDTKQFLQFNSQIFVSIPIEVQLTHGVINETETTTEIMTVGKLNRDKLDNKLMEEQYNKFYKPIIEYNFTEYNYEYVIRRTINNKTGLIISANAGLMEAVKYNYQFITQFDLKMIDG